DMVVNLGNVKAGEFDRVTDEIRLLKKEAGDKVLKVIIETCYLTDEEKIALCRCVTEGGADFIKTSTGFGTGGATMKDIELLKANIGPGVRVKASGGIRTAEDILSYLHAGVDRIGASGAISAFEGRNKADDGGNY
ncbi:MAG: deoxyribose-phosphate aldolase, partial [Clostridia bacterium]|nr:deoxyribose-phosphate aldolase [Clostridia bacterium]